jgi:hypothetical protein
MSMATQGEIETALKDAPSTTSQTALAQMALYLAATSPDAAIQR